MRKDISGRLLTLAWSGGVTCCLALAWTLAATVPALAEVDWKHGRITAVGVGVAPPTVRTAAQRRAMATRCATVVAQRKLLESIKGVQVDSATRVANYMVTKDIVESRLAGVLEHAQILSTRDLGDGSMEVTMGVSLRGELAEMLMPVEETHAAAPAPASSVRVAVPKPEPVEAPAPVIEEPLAESVQVASLAPVALPVKKEHDALDELREVSGVVVDAKGLGVKPAMSPKIFDERGEEVYGSRFVGREYAIQQGMAGYAKDMDQACANPRVAGKPLRVRALRVTGKARTDLVVSNDDAAKLRSLAANQDFLEKCRVMIVLD